MIPAHCQALAPAFTRRSQWSRWGARYTHAISSQPHSLSAVSAPSDKQGDTGHSFNKSLLSAYYERSSVLGTGDQEGRSPAGLVLRDQWGMMSALSLNSCVSMGDFLGLSELQFPLLQLWAVVMIQ